jgi:hypothetical protein
MGSEDDVPEAPARVRRADMISVLWWVARRAPRADLRQSAGPRAPGQRRGKRRLDLNARTVRVLDHGGPFAVVPRPGHGPDGI